MTTAKLADAAVTSAKLASNLTLSGTTSGTFSGNGSGLTGVTSTFADGSVTTAKLANNAVTAAKLDASTVGIWSVSGANVFRSNGNVGIGVAAPNEKLEVGSDGTTQIVAQGNGGSGGAWFLGQAFNGTLAAPTGIVTGNTLASFRGRGHDTSGFTGSRATMSFVATQNWSTTAQGTEIQFATTANGNGVGGTAERMKITHDGKIRIGTPNTNGFTGDFGAPLVITHSNNAAIQMNTFGGDNWVVGTAAGGTVAAPTAVTQGQDLISIRGRGFNSTTDAGASRATITLGASDNWTASSNGTHITFSTCPIGSAQTPTERMRILHDGKVGIGNNNPSFTLQVQDAGAETGRIHVGSRNANASAKLISFGDADLVMIGENGADDRMELKASEFFFNVGNVGIGAVAAGFKLDVNGGIRCIGAVNTSSDARFKTDVRPVTAALETISALRGVSYEWNHAAFPDKGFPKRRSIGFIAQEVEKVLPEVVTKGGDGYYSLAYSEVIPVLVEAAKELKAENAAVREKLATLEARDRQREARDQAREARLTRLENALDDRPARTVRASLDLK